MERTELLESIQSLIVTPIHPKINTSVDGLTAGSLLVGRAKVTYQNKSILVCSGTWGDKKIRWRLIKLIHPDLELKAISTTKLKNAMKDVIREIRDADQKSLQSDTTEKLRAKARIKINTLVEKYQSEARDKIHAIIRQYAMALTKEDYIRFWDEAVVKKILEA